MHNARHFHCALILLVLVLCGELVVALLTP
nr:MULTISPECIES: DUF3265 domain-containing protein [Vibrio]